MSAGAVVLALVSVLLWSSLAVLGTQLTHVPPFLLVGIALSVSGLIGLVKVKSWKVPLSTLFIGVGGIFGYHFLLFMAFRLAPAVEANLLNYLWPLSIVMLSPIFLKGYRLRLHHVAGALTGLAGAFFIVTGGKLRLDAANLPGYALAILAALVWAAYSLLTKRIRPFSTAAVGGFCLASGILSLVLFALETGAGGSMPALSARDWLFLVLLGIGPMGAAFFTWDAALKRGDPRIIGSLSYLTPLLSTLNLIIFGGRRLSAVSALAMVLIIAGAVLGSLDLLRARERVAANN